MQEQLEQSIGQIIALHTDKAVEIGILQGVTADGVFLKPLPKKTRDVDAEHVFFGGGFFPFRRFGGFGFPGFFPGFGFPRFGFGFRRPFFW